MKKKLIGVCPVCEGKLSVSELLCKDCGTKISGEFQLSKFDLMDEEHQNFALMFLKNAGNIKAIEREMGISYPTVKKLLDETIASLGFDKVKYNETPLSRKDILTMLKNGEIGFDEAEKMLKELGEC